MYPVTYEHEFPYSTTPAGRPFPILQFRICVPGHPEPALDLHAQLDSGAERSLFDGWIAPDLNLDLLGGPELSYLAASGVQITARLHPLQFYHASLGTFSLEVGLSTSRITRNLLGRDFFNLMQIGFRERHLLFYITASP